IARLHFRWQPTIFCVLGFFVLVGATSVRAQQSAVFDPATARGNAVNVTCEADASQSYALYLPSKYTPERRWPIIYAFDPFARGKTAVEGYRAAAEKYGYIVVGSNNAKNGPTRPEMAAAQAMWNDNHHHPSQDQNHP